MLNDIDIKSIKGLSDAEAARRLREEGYNELPATKRRSIFAIAFEVIREPMFLLLVAGGAIYLIVVDIEEAVLLLSFAFVVMGITFYQERKTERALFFFRRQVDFHCLRHGEDGRDHIVNQKEKGNIDHRGHVNANGDSSLGTSVPFTFTRFLAFYNFTGHSNHSFPSLHSSGATGGKFALLIRDDEEAG
jgi:hypothetical protein